MSQASRGRQWSAWSWTICGVLLVIGGFTWAGGMARAEEAVAVTEAAKVGLDYEAAPMPKLEDVVPAPLLANENYTVTAPAPASHYYYAFQIEAKDPQLGSFDVNSLAMLKTRCHELDVLAAATAAAVDESRTGEFVSSVGAEISGVAKSTAKSFVTPVATIRSVDGQITSGAKNIYDFVRRKSRNQPKEPFLIGAEKRAFAKQLGVDVYSTNAPLQELLTKHAKVRTSGSTMVSAGISVTTYVVPVLSPVGFVIGAAKYRDKAADKVNTFSPMDLYHYNDGLLKKMEVKSSERERFLELSWLSPRQKTEIVSNLEGLHALNNSTDFLNALETNPGSDGVWQVECTEMIAKYNETIEPIEAIRSSGAALIATTTQGRRVVFFPADILYWDEEAAKLFNSEAKQAATDQPPACIVSGKVTARAQKEFESRNFTVQENFMQSE